MTLTEMEDLITRRAKDDASWAIAWALLEVAGSQRAIAEQLEDVATHLKNLGKRL